MSLLKVKAILQAKYGNEIANNLLDSYLEIEHNFFIGKWKPSELDAGHFVETVRRILELELFGSHTPFNAQISSFTDQVLLRYEQATGFDESYRIVIPRILKGVYNIRNKRGVAHITTISPNEMDATVILYNVKWVLAEITRLASNLRPTETQQLIDNIVERQVEVLWKQDGFRRILDTSITKIDQVLIHLYDESPQSAEALRNHIEYANKTNFRSLLKTLHVKKLIEANGENCTLSPTGRLAAEKIIIKAKSKKI